MLSRDPAYLRRGMNNGPQPLAVVLSGSSSRAPIEMIFDVALGDVFCARITGNVSGPSILGSLEYACIAEGAKVIIVLGHTDNRAVRVAIESLVEPASVTINGECLHLNSILVDIQQSVDPQWKADWATVTDEVRHARIDEVARAHVRRTIRRILELSPALARLHREQCIKLVGGMYDVCSGAVELFETAHGPQVDAGEAAPPVHPPAMAPVAR